MESALEGSKCKSCNFFITDLANALINGCPSCSNRSFKFIKKSTKDVQSLKESLDFLVDKAGESGVGVGIKVIDRGTFRLDIKALAENSDDLDPVIIQDQKGVINIIIDPDEDE